MKTAEDLNIVKRLLSFQKSWLKIDLTKFIYEFSTQKLFKKHSKLIKYLWSKTRLEELICFTKAGHIIRTASAANHIIGHKFVIYDPILKTIVVLDKMIYILHNFIHTTFLEQPFSQYFDLKAFNGRHLKYGNFSWYHKVSYNITI